MKIPYIILLIAAILGVAAALIGIFDFPSQDAAPTGEDISTVDTPAAAVIEDAPAAAPAPPTFDVVRVSREGTGVIAGRSAPEAFVEVMASGSPIGRVRSNRDGEWVLIFDTPLSPGSQELSLRAHLPDIEPIESTEVVVVAVPDRSEGTFEEDEQEGVVAVLTPRYGVGVSRVLQKPGAVRRNVELSVDTADYDEEGDAVFSGRAVPEAEVRFYLDNEFIGSTIANESGEWVFEPEGLISSEEHMLRLDQIFEGDNVTLRVEQPFNPRVPLDRALAEGHVVVRPGNSLWHIARRLYGTGFLYTQIFGANEELIKDPNLIYPGQKFALPPPDLPAQTEQPAAQTP